MNRLSLGTEPLHGRRGCGLSVIVTVLLLSLAAEAQVDHKPGDLNGDGCVDNADLAALQAAIGGVPAGPCPAAADFDNDGIIGIADFGEFVNYYYLAPVACREDISPFACTSYTACDTVCEGICNLPDNGSGTVDLPPAGCSYLSPGNFHAIVNGLPPGTELNVSAAHRGFTNITRTPGGSLGGEVETFDSEVRLEIHGTGTLAGYDRVIVVPDVPVEIHSAPKQPGQASQSFATDMRALDLEIDAAAADPDFELLHITAGTDNGMSSPGRTGLVETSSFDTFSYFDVSYQMEFIGRAGGPLAGASGITTGVVRMGTPQSPKAPLAPAIGPFGLLALIVSLATGGALWQRRSRAH